MGWGCSRSSREYRKNLFDEERKPSLGFNKHSKGDVGWWRDSFAVGEITDLGREWGMSVRSKIGFLDAEDLIMLRNLFNSYQMELKVSVLVYLKCKCMVSRFGKI